MIPIMATISEYQGYRAIGDFAQRYKKERVPAYATVRRVVQDVDHKKFGDIFSIQKKRHLQKQTH